MVAGSSRALAVGRALKHDGPRMAHFPSRKATRAANWSGAKGLRM
jgi:hypothetical protein